MPSNSIECGDAPTTRVLHAMLTEVADPLMRAGITPRLFGDLAAHAFVKAACKAATLRNGRINQSRVAVLTGLSRAEVRNVLRGGRNTKARFQPRTQRVVDGWLSDTRYLLHGAPRALPVNGPGASFATLVKKYAGDVPHHAVLEELRRQKLVKEGQESLRLVTPVMSASRAFQKSLHLLLALMSDGVAVAGASSARSTRGLHRLTLKAKDARDSIALYQRALTSTASFVSGLDQSLQSAPTRKSKKGGGHITVSVLVRLKEPDAKTRRQRNVPTRD
jgi:hypothetical protein